MSEGSNPKDLVGMKKAPLRYVPPAMMIEASGPAEDGAIKYGPFNWRDIPIQMTSYLEAAMRHLLALMDGEDVAADSGYSHLGHILQGIGIVVDAKAHGTLIDDRFTAGPASEMLAERDKSKPRGGITHESWPGRTREERIAGVKADFDSLGIPGGSELGEAFADAMESIERRERDWLQGGLPHFRPVSGASSTFEEDSNGKD